MTSVTSQLSISLDGYVAGPHQSLQDPIGRGGMRLHEWVVHTPTWREQHGLEVESTDGAPGDPTGETHPDEAVATQLMRGIGAYIMGRNMFGGERGPQGDWDGSWTGWWGEDPPYHAPVFVLSHHLRETLVMQGGTTFSFVSDGIRSALQQAQAAAGELDVSIAGGASTVRQFIAAGLLDELHLHIVPVLLGSGERLFDSDLDVSLDIVSTVASPNATHVKYRLRR